MSFPETMNALTGVDGVLIYKKGKLGKWNKRQGLPLLGIRAIARSNKVGQL